MERPNYYGIMPANVRYDNNLKPMEKIMYSEITALSNKNGYCNASNKYFVELYKVHKDTVSSWINNLKKYGYVEIELIKENNCVKERRIYIVGGIGKKADTYLEKDLEGIGKKADRGIGKKAEGNNTSNNNTSNNNKELSSLENQPPKTKESIPSVFRQEIDMLIKSYKLTTTVEKLCMFAEADYPLVVKQLRAFGEKGTGYVIDAIKNKYDTSYIDNQEEEKLINMMKGCEDVFLNSYLHNADSIDPKKYEIMGKYFKSKGLI